VRGFFAAAVEHPQAVRKRRGGCCLVARSVVVKKPEPKPEPEGDAYDANLSRLIELGEKYAKKQEASD